MTVRLSDVERRELLAPIRPADDQGRLTPEFTDRLLAERLAMMPEVRAASRVLLFVVVSCLIGLVAAVATVVGLWWHLRG